MSQPCLHNQQQRTSQTQILHRKRGSPPTEMPLLRHYHRKKRRTTTILKLQTNSNSHTRTDTANKHCLNVEQYKRSTIHQQIQNVYITKSNILNTDMSAY